MTGNTSDEATTTPSADEAFASLGNETRLQILQTLGAAEEPLAFSEVFDRVEYDDSSNFGYHLERLVGHFIRKTGDGYALQQAGQRVVEAVLSGVLTDDPTMEPTTVDRPCPLCSTPIQVAFQDERVEMHCSECPGIGSGGYKTAEEDRFEGFGNLGYILLPPAGVQGRKPEEVLHAAEIWTASQGRSVGRGICPRCSATIEYTTEVCADHVSGDGRCDRCGKRMGAMFSASCTNCSFDMDAPMVVRLTVNTGLLVFMVEHGIDPMSPEGFDFPYSRVEETIVSTDPIEVRFSYAVDGEELVITVDGSLSIVDETRRAVADPDD